jgi:hypothetical protein
VTRKKKTEIQYSRKEIVQNLEHTILSITFEKVDGTIRTMNATLLPEWIPKLSKTFLPEGENHDVICCFDIDNLGWRSFRVNNVISVQLHDPNDL